MNAEQGETEEVQVAMDLVRRIRQGDRTAENELVRRYGDRLRYVLHRQMAAYPHDLDDIIQDAFTAAILKLRDVDIDYPARLGGFIYGIAKNLRLAKLREHARHDGSADPEVIQNIPDSRVSPERALSEAQTTRVVRQLLAELGNHRGRERDREVLVRLFIKQQSREEVCEALDLSPEHLRRVIYRAKQRLKVLMMELLDQTNLERIADE